MKKYLNYIYLLLINMLLVITPSRVNADNIELIKSKITIGIGYSETLKYNLDEGLNSEDIVWRSSNENIAIVENGKVIAISEGSTIITASINGKNSTCRINVVSNYIPATGLKLNKNSITLLVGNTEKLTKTISPLNATNSDVTWISSNPSVATVNSSGLITAVAPGKASIIASVSGFEKTCEVTVVYSLSLKNITLNKTNINIKEKSSEQLNVIYQPNNATNKKVTWKSSNTNIAIVDSSGIVTGVSPGSSTITVVSNDGGYVATCEVTVEEISKKVTSISLDKNELKLAIGEESILNTIIIPDYAENKNVTWTSSNKKIATVEDGKVKAISPGTVEIKVTSEDGNKEAICKVTVISPPVEEISFEKKEQTVYINSQTNLKLIAKPANAVLENAIWTSTDENVATVENGRVNAIALGTTTVTVSNQDNTLTASIKVIVIEKPKEQLNIVIEGYNLNFSPNKKNYNLTIGNESQLTITANVEEKNISIKGNQKLKDGSIITITITDEEKTTYVININKEQNYTIYFIAIISLLLLINLIRIMTKNKKKSKF